MAVVGAEVVDGLGSDVLDADSGSVVADTSGSSSPADGVVCEQAARSNTAPTTLTNRLDHIRSTLATVSATATPHPGHSGR